ncbi:MAG: hypothetical protein LDLANPLL_01452 [Turneriella sp.]|nr:hypothetical protein [Turneriella sp.]
MKTNTSAFTKNKTTGMQKNIMNKLFWITLLFSVGFWGTLDARTKLVTMPQREYTRIDLKNPDQTIVEEERTVNLQKGINHIEYAFSGVSVDINSVQFRAIKTPGQTRVLNVNYPPGENALFWEVYSEKAGPGVFRISYLIQNIYRTTAYEAVVAKNEKTLTLQAHTMVQNGSGENFERAAFFSTLGDPYEGSLQKGESKKILSFTTPDVHFRKNYFFDYSRSNEVSLLYTMLNEKSSGFPEVMLPNGKARVYQEDSQGSEAFLGEDWTQETGAGQKLELKLGQAKEVRVKRSVVQYKEEIVRLPIKNFHQTVKYQIENFKDAPVALTLVEHPGGEWLIEGIEVKEEAGERESMHEKSVSGNVKEERVDINELKLHVSVPANGREKKKMNVYVKLVLKNRW